MEVRVGLFQLTQFKFCFRKHFVRFINFFTFLLGRVRINEDKAIEEPVDR